MTVNSAFVRPEPRITSYNVCYTKLLRYLKPLYRELLLPLLDRLGRDRFKVFPDPKADYAEALATARALVAPAGHQSISEALALGKPVFAIPVEGQFEQELNARKLRETGFGDWSDYRNLESYNFV